MIYRLDDESKLIIVFLLLCWLSITCQGLGMIWASLHSKTVLTNVFRSAVVAGAGAARRSRRHRR